MTQDLQKTCWSEKQEELYEIKISTHSRPSISNTPLLNSGSTTTEEVELQKYLDNNN
jgi:hypothetical protein